MIDVILKLTFIDDMIDLFSDTLDSSIVSNLTDNVLVIFALAELEALVDWLVGVCDDVFKAERAKLAPLLLHSLESNTSCFSLIFSIGSFVNHWLLGSCHVWRHFRLVKILLVVRNVTSLICLYTHGLLLCQSWRVISNMNAFIKFLKILLLPVFHVLIDSPIVHLFIKHVFGILIVELWEYLSVISKVVNECFEGLAISV